MEALNAAGWTIELVCISSCGSVEKSSEQFQLRSKGKTHLIEWPWLFRIPLVRHLFFLLFRSGRGKIPTTAAGFAHRSVSEKITEVIQKSNALCVVWDGLHPLAAMQVRGTGRDNPIRCKLHLYRAHNIESNVWKTSFQRARRFLKMFMRSEWEKMRRFESSCLSWVDGVLCLNQEEQRELMGVFPELPLVGYVPVSFPATKFSRRADEPSDQPAPASGHGRQLKTLHLVWLGGMDWRPNREGLGWFMREVWPQVYESRQNAELTLVGAGTERWKGVTPSRLQVLGRVATAAEWLERAHLLVVPVFSGAGIRIKALEAMAAGVACVGTPLGLSGVPQQGVFLCDGKEEWISLLCSLSALCCEQKGRRARTVIVEQYGHNAAANAFENCLSQALLTKTREKA
jgi:glycosyltransferase involved in cell wall biosynthesis